METIKTACMVIVLMAIGYGVYTVLNQPEEMPPEVAEGVGDTLDLALPDFSQMAMPAASDNTPRLEASQLPPVSISAPPTGLATGRLTAPQLDEASGNNAPGYTASVSDMAPPANPAAQAAASRFAATSPDLPPLASFAPPAPGGSAEGEDPAPPAVAAATPAEAPIPTSDDSSQNMLASVYTRANGQDNLAAPPSAREYGLDSASDSPSDSAPPSTSFAADWDEAQVYLRQHDLVEAARILTPWRGRPELTPSQKEELALLLSQLAGTVVYSMQHLLEEPYTVGSGETIESIARQFEVPAILLQRINGLDSSGTLNPGQKLKVVRGPFTAAVDLAHHELTLEVDGCYAGRFPITVEDGTAIPPGEHEVLRKEANPQYFDDASNRILAADDPDNPYGGYAVHLDGGIVLHGSGGPGGSISLSPRDAEDVYGILSVGSKVVVRR